MTSLTGRILYSSFLRKKKNPDDRITLAGVRQQMEEMSRNFRLPKGLIVQPCTTGSVPAEWLIPEGVSENKTLLYFHGGGFVMNSLNTHRALTSRIAEAGAIRALSVDYRLAPEHPYPAAIDDCLAVWKWLISTGESPSNIVVAGDSAGGNLALTLMLSLRDAGEPLPAAAVCLSPITDLALTGESIRTKAALDPILSAPGAGPVRTTAPVTFINPAEIKATEISLSWYYRNHDPREPLLSPLYADLRGLPPVLLHAGEYEILLDDSIRIADRIHATGGKAELVVWPRMFHVFQMLAPLLPEAGKSIRQIGAFIRKNTGSGRR